MITQLTLRGFKNFEDATLRLGPLTLVVGTNASGKSNLRDAFRFLHGIARGYTLAEVIGEKWLDGGVLQWRGIRGGIREVSFGSSREFTISTVCGLQVYSITVAIDDKGVSRVKREVLRRPKALNHYYYSTHPTDDPVEQNRLPETIRIRLPRGGRHRKHGPIKEFSSRQPILTQLVDDRGYESAMMSARDKAEKTIAQLAQMRFLDLSPDAMREPSLPGQNILGDRGENLSSVLQDIYSDESRRRALVEWLRELTPMDVTSLEFLPDQTGKVLVSLIESNGSRISAHSASDGTLRFLAIAAALLSSKPGTLYFLEEPENGIHPARLHLLLELIERQVSRSQTQLIATTHSPQLLGLLSAEARSSASLVYRSENESAARIVPIMQIPGIAEVLQADGLNTLHATGWLEDAASCLLPSDNLPSRRTTSVRRTTTGEKGVSA